MKSKLLIPLAGVACIGTIGLQTSCAEAPKPAAQAANPQVGVKASVLLSQVKTLKLPEFDAALPPGKGKETVVLMCAVCHTTHYILNQPSFPREVWMAEVTKMQKTFSAPIPDDKVPEILDYLMAVRGPMGN